MRKRHTGSQANLVTIALVYLLSCIQASVITLPMKRVNHGNSTMPDLRDTKQGRHLQLDRIVDWDEVLGAIDPNVTTSTEWKADNPDTQVLIVVNDNSFF